MMRMQEINTDSICANLLHPRHPGAIPFMTYIAEINIMTRPEILDPQGKAVQLGLHNLQMDSVHNVRIGKHIRLEVEAWTEDEARQTVDSACRQLLANLIMEEYTFTLHAV